MDAQYQELRQILKDKKPKLYSRAQITSRAYLGKSKAGAVDKQNAREWLCRSHFDEFAKACGYDDVFVNKIFSYVQKAITLEKKLFEEFFCPEEALRQKRLYIHKKRKQCKNHKWRRKYVYNRARQKYSLLFQNCA